jgi:hypothetical protein
MVLDGKINVTDTHTQPFTPPAVNPPTTRSWKTAISTQIGTIAMIRAC